MFSLYPCMCGSHTLCRHLRVEMLVFPTAQSPMFNFYLKTIMFILLVIHTQSYSVFVYSNTEKRIWILLFLMALQVVPTIYTNIRGHKINSNQVSLILLIIWIVLKFLICLFFSFYENALLFYSSRWLSIIRVPNLVTLIYIQEFSSSTIFLPSRWDLLSFPYNYSLIEFTNDFFCQI